MRQLRPLLPGVEPAWGDAERPDLTINDAQAGAGTHPFPVRPGVLVLLPPRVPLARAVPDNLATRRGRCGTSRGLTTDTQPVGRPCGARHRTWTLPSTSV